MPNRTQARRILVVDDDELVLRSVARVLGRSGLLVTTASDVAEATRALATAEFDGALVDYQLARESGLEVFSVLLARQPLCIRMLFTGRSDPAVIVDAVNRGEIVKVLRKPFHPEQLLAEIDDAFHTAERQRRALETNPEALADRVALDEVLRPENLGMALQPLFDAAGGTPELFAYECLLRPRHPRLFHPSSLFDAALRHGRVLELGEIALRHAGAILRRLPPGPMLFVNVHPDQLQDPVRLRADLAPLLSAPERVILEITEQAATTSQARWEESLEVMAQAGFRTAVDDLGSGYSSLSILAELKPNFIKLDMSLVRNVHREPRKQRLVALMSSFGSATDARVVAEGIECAEEARALRDAGVEIFQGFHFARPSEAYVPLSRAPATAVAR